MNQERWAERWKETTMTRWEDFLCKVHPTNSTRVTAMTTKKKKRRTKKKLFDVLIPLKCMHMLAQQCNSIPIKLKQTKGRHGAKEDKRSAITKGTGDVDGVLSVVGMGSRSEPYFQIVFDQRSQAEDYVDRKTCPVQFGVDKYYPHLILKGVSRSTFEARLLPINEHGKATGIGVPSSTTNAVRTFRDLLPTHSTLVKYMHDKLVVKGGVNYEESNAKLTGAEVYWIPTVMGMDGDTAAGFLPDFLKVADTMSNAKGGVVQQIFLVARHYNLTCELCTKVGHKTNSMLCELNPQGFSFARKAEHARQRALDPDIRKRVRRM